PKLQCEKVLLARMPYPGESVNPLSEPGILVWALSLSRSVGTGQRRRLLGYIMNKLPSNWKRKMGNILLFLECRAAEKVPSIIRPRVNPSLCIMAARGEKGKGQSSPRPPARTLKHGKPSWQPVSFRSSLLGNRPLNPDP